MAGMKVIKANVIIDTNKNGNTATMTLPTGSREISDAAKRQTASGGVNRPIFRINRIFFACGEMLLGQRPFYPGDPVNSA